MNKTAVLLTAALLATSGQAQTTTTAPRTTASSSSNNSDVPYFRSTTSIRDNPGILGHSFADLHYSWVDFHRDAGLDADGYIAGVRTNMPVVPGLDVGIGYDYYRENNHRNPFTGTPYDARYHEGSARATLFTSLGRVKPFMGGGVGYQWSRGDIQRLRTFDHEWVWNATAGFEAILGYVAVIPRVSYVDTIEDHGGAGFWSYGAQLHHWFNEQVGGYLDATFHDPRSNSGVEWWTYTAGVRLRF